MKGLLSGAMKAGATAVLIAVVAIVTGSGVSAAPRAEVPHKNVIGAQDCDWALKTLDWDIQLDELAVVQHPSDAAYYTDTAATWRQAKQLILKDCGRTPVAAVPGCHEVADWFGWAHDLHASYVDDPAAVKDSQWNEDWAARYARLQSLTGCSP